MEGNFLPYLPRYNQNELREKIKFYFQLKKFYKITCFPSYPSMDSDAFSSDFCVLERCNSRRGFLHWFLFRGRFPVLCPSFIPRYNSKEQIFILKQTVTFFFANLSLIQFFFSGFRSLGIQRYDTFFNLKSSCRILKTCTSDNTISLVIIKIFTLLPISAKFSTLMMNFSVRACKKSSWFWVIWVACVNIWLGNMTSCSLHTLSPFFHNYPSD